MSESQKRKVESYSVEENSARGIMWDEYKRMPNSIDKWTILPKVRSATRNPVGRIHTIGKEEEEEKLIK